MQPSQEYMSLATTLLDAIGDNTDASDTVLLQLQALFGPMLTSALQLVDKREVVRVSLPHGRYVYQITASTGKPYTLHLDLPGSPATEKSPKAPVLPPDDPRRPPALDTTNTDLTMPDKEPEKELREGSSVALAKRRRLDTERKMIEGMYCPCPGFAYNSLAGERNVLCKHLLAALIGWKTGREIKTEVPLHGVVSLLGLQARAVESTIDDSVQIKPEIAS